MKIVAAEFSIECDAWPGPRHSSFRGHPCLRGSPNLGWQDSRGRRLRVVLSPRLGRSLAEFESIMKCWPILANALLVTPRHTKPDG